MLNCGCDLNYDEPHVYERQILVARKAHVCCECGEEIARGRGYERTSGLWDDRWLHFDTCLTCVAIWDLLCHGERAHGDLAELLWETNGVPLVGDTSASWRWETPDPPPLEATP